MNCYRCVELMEIMKKCFCWPFLSILIESKLTLNGLLIHFLTSRWLYSFKVFVLWRTGLFAFKRWARSSHRLERHTRLFRWPVWGEWKHSKTILPFYSKYATVPNLVWKKTVQPENEHPKLILLKFCLVVLFWLKFNLN